METLELDRYQRPLPYSVLNLGPEATAKEIVNRRNELKRDLQESNMDSSKRAKEMQRIEEAYDKLSKASLRIRIDFFLLDPKLFLTQCQAIAQAVAKPQTDVEGVIKPRRIRVQHTALLDDLRLFQGEPGKVLGLQHRPMEIKEADGLPEPLAIQFDC